MTTNKCKNKRKEYYEKRKEKVNQRDGMCPLRPNNIGLKCENITEVCCAACGWNPKVHEMRINEGRYSDLLLRRVRK